ncbi:MAG: hypothetical protein J6M07_02500 [Ruminococcus sp.]|nr:hypothetical protein [Ruminococcus sp.]MBP3267180.1 hypothetical protein [Ruminococcus sp.]
MGNILEFIAEYGFILLAGVPSVILLGYYFIRFIKHLIAEPKGTLKIVFIIIGVLAALIVPAFFLGEDLWASILQGGFLLLIFIGFAKFDPKGAKKIVLSIIAAVFAVVVTGFIFGIGPAVLAGINGIMALLMYLPFKYLIKTIKLEKNGAQTTGTVIGRTYGRSAGHIISYTDIDGNYHSGQADLMLIRWWKNGAEVDVLYDCDAPDNFTVKTRGLLNSIVMFSLMFILQAAVLVGSIWFYLSIA